MTKLRSRHPFPDVEERDAPPGTVLTDGEHTWTVGGEKPRPPDIVTAPPARGLLLHQGENRRMRRAGVATFTPHADLPEGPGLRRRLVKQRQRSGTLDPELRRLQKAKLRKAKP